MSRGRPIRYDCANPPAWTFAQLALVTDDGQRWLRDGSAIMGEPITATTARLYAETSSGDLGTAQIVWLRPEGGIHVYGSDTAQVVELLLTGAAPGTAAGLPIIRQGTLLGRFVFPSFRP